VALAYFAKGPLAKAAASGMVAYSAGQLAARYAVGATLEAAPTQAAITAETAAVKALISTNPYHRPSGSTRTGAVHVGGMTFTVEE